MRYIGNKSKLLNEIDALLEEKSLDKKGLVFCDIFSGTGTVANQYNGFYKIIANDFLDLSYRMTAGMLTFNEKKAFVNLDVDPFEYFNNIDTDNYEGAFCYNNFCPHGNTQYFSDDNAKRIDFIRNTIDEWYENKKIDDSEKSYLIMCLLEAVSKVSNVAGVYSACLKIWDSRALKVLDFKPIETKTTKYKNIVYCSDANELVKSIKGDILYLDPPYTPTQYNSQYHVLETIVRNDNPKTHGVGKHRNNDRLSKWCVKGQVEVEFERIIKNANFKHIIFSYSDKGLMSVKFIEAVLKRYAKEGTYTFKKINFVKYKSTRAVNKENVEGTKNKEHYEYLFYIEKSDDVKYSSPLNYIGGKYSTLDLIKNNLPKEINEFYDVFGGGSTVSINTNAKNVHYNEINCYVVSLLQYLANEDIYSIYKELKKYIKKFKLEKGNKEAYIALREDYNKTKKDILLYLLICYGFEHQIRFNSNHQFNNPCGNSGFNEEMFEKLISFNLRCQEINIDFECGDYQNLLNDIKTGDFVYLDPPYFADRGVYQDGKRGFNGWDEQQEYQLYDFIDSLNDKGVKFMLSNYSDEDIGSNEFLLEWIKKKDYKLIFDDKITKRNRTRRREIIIINY